MIHVAEISLSSKVQSISDKWTIRMCNFKGMTTEGERKNYSDKTRSAVVLSKNITRNTVIWYPGLCSGKLVTVHLCYYPMTFTMLITMTGFSTDAK